MPSLPEAHRDRLSVATRLLASGASISLWDRDAEVAASALDQLRDLGQVSVEIGDVSNLESVTAATENTILKHGKIDILVASAGLAGPNYKSWEYPIEAWKQVLDINLTGVFLCCRAIVPHMLRQNYGRIVNSSSIAGKEGSATASGYRASKGGVICFH
jgi:3-oxoacyl-[acyl-carrier protein] reductase